jgi:AcrR family transcriptional regulator
MAQAAQPAHAAQPAGGRQLRADAQQNRSRILDAALDVFVEQGPAAPLEEISRRAGTGIATLYRRFPDRQALMKAVVLDALQRTAEEALRATDEEPDAFSALVRYMHRTLDVRTAAVIPALLEVIPLDDEELVRVREQGRRRLEDMVDAAHRAGTLASDVTSGDIGMLVVRLSRPLPGAVSRELNNRLGHRHLDVLINGLRTAGDRPAQIEGPAMTLQQLRTMSPAADTESG